ncbi:transport permease protein [Microtetraspora sp. NBRC 13810]|uniref:ABC transporter permease n=1 Tax=Microtetraspora sp. NBRC 13810 TaxID=3030990 RepID=UPI0024A0D5CF|nr:ABC transporter permease [Microtetraspora sp. NBRC 13810]GLW12446.1 transport permease protein [Microtetraspora sp. NBRC 13810]
MTKILAMETKLYLREPAGLLISLLLPLGLLLGIGGISAPDPGDQQTLETHLPGMMTTLAVMTLGFTILPGTLAAYRESGVLRRMSTTPVSPGKVLVVQLLINLVVAVLAGVVLIVAGNLVHGIAVPRQPGWFVLAFVLGSASLFAIGLLLAALVPNAKLASGIGSVLMFPLMFVSGMWMARETMPEFLRRIGDFLPVAPFGQALRDTWWGAAPNPRDLIVITLTLVVAGAVAVRFFRWE